MARFENRNISRRRTAYPVLLIGDFAGERPCCMIQAMGILIRIFVLLVFASAMRPGAMRLQAALPQATPANCCAMMKMMDEPLHDCGKHIPKSKQDRPCCAACTVGVTLFIAGSAIVSPPPATEASFVGYTVDEHIRSHRPPVPPPRFAIT